MASQSTHPKQHAVSSATTAPGDLIGAGPAGPALTSVSNTAPFAPETLSTTRSTGGVVTPEVGEGPHRPSDGMVKDCSRSEAREIGVRSRDSETGYRSVSGVLPMIPPAFLVDSD